MTGEGKRGRNWGAILYISSIVLCFIAFVLTWLLNNWDWDLCKHHLPPNPTTYGLICLSASVFLLLIAFGFTFLKGEHNKKNKALLTSSIVLLIFSFLVLPNFVRGTSFICQNEAKHNLGAIFTAYTAYYADYGTYPTSPEIIVKGQTFNCLNVTEWEPIGQLRYTYVCNGKQAYYPGWDGTGTMSKTDCKHSYLAHADKNSFTIVACGNVDNDAALEEWTIDDAKHLRNVVDDVKN